MSCDGRSLSYATRAVVGAESNATTAESEPCRRVRRPRARRQRYARGARYGMPCLSCSVCKNRFVVLIFVLQHHRVHVSVAQQRVVVVEGD